MSYRIQTNTLPRPQLKENRRRVPVGETLRTAKENIWRAVQKIKDGPKDISPGTENLLTGFVGKEKKL